MDTSSGVWLMCVELNKKLGHLLPKWPYCFLLSPGIYRESQLFCIVATMCHASAPFSGGSSGLLHCEEVSVVE